MMPPRFRTVCILSSIVVLIAAEVLHAGTDAMNERLARMKNRDALETWVQGKAGTDAGRAGILIQIEMSYWDSLLDARGVLRSASLSGARRELEDALANTLKVAQQKNRRPIDFRKERGLFACLVAYGAALPDSLALPGSMEAVSPGPADAGAKHVKTAPSPPESLLAAVRSGEYQLKRLEDGQTLFQWFILALVVLTVGAIAMIVYGLRELRNLQERVNRAIEELRAARQDLYKVSTMLDPAINYAEKMQIIIGALDKLSSDVNRLLEDGASTSGHSNAMTRTSLVEKAEVPGQDGRAGASVESPVRPVVWNKVDDSSRVATQAVRSAGGGSSGYLEEYHKAASGDKQMRKTFLGRMIRLDMSNSQDVVANKINEVPAFSETDSDNSFFLAPKGGSTGEIELFVKFNLRVDDPMNQSILATCFEIESGKGSKTSFEILSPAKIVRNGPGWMLAAKGRVRI